MAIPWALLGQFALQGGQAYLENRAQRAEQRALNRAIDRQRERQQEETNFSNLVNVFGGRSTPMQVPLSYRGSDKANTLRSLGQIAGLGSQAIGLYEGMQQAQKAAEMQDLQKQNIRDQIDIRRGTLEASGIPLSAGKAAGPIAVGGGAMGPVGPSGAGSRTAGATLRMGNYQAPASLSQIGQAAFNAQLRDRQANLAKESADLRSQDIINQLRQAQIDNLNRPKTPPGALTDSQQAAIETRRQADEFGRATSDVKSYLTNNPMGTWESYLAEQGINRFELSSKQIGALENEFNLNKEARRQALTQEQGDLYDRLSKDPTFKKIASFRDSFLTLNSVLDRIEQDGKATGADQIAAINAFQRLIDDATVREGDVDLIKTGQSNFQSFYTAIKRSYEEGNVVDDQLVLSMRGTANAMMEAYGRKADEILSTFETSQAFASPYVLDLVINQGSDRMMGQMVRNYIDQYATRKTIRTGADASADTVSTINNIKRARLLQNSDVNAYGNTGTY